MGEVVTFGGLVREIGPTSAILVVAIVAWWRSNTADSRQKSLLVGQQSKVFDALLERVLHGDDAGAPSLSKLQQSIDEVQAVQLEMSDHLAVGDAKFIELAGRIAEWQRHASAEDAALRVQIESLARQQAGKCPDA